MTFTGFCRSVVSVSVLGLGSTVAFAADAQVPKASPRTVADITQILTSYKPDPKKAADARAILDREPPQTTDRSELAKLFASKADAANEISATSWEASGR